MMKEKQLRTYHVKYSIANGKSRSKTFGGEGGLREARLYALEKYRLGQLLSFKNSNGISLTL